MAGVNVNVGVLTVISEVSPEVKLIVTVPEGAESRTIVVPVYVFPSVSVNVGLTTVTPEGTLGIPGVITGGT